MHDKNSKVFWNDTMRVESLGFFRFLAAIVVVLAHFAYTTAGKGVGFAGSGIVNGVHMVTFFFVLSGFVNYLAYGVRAPFSMKHFIASRVARVFPLYFFALLITIQALVIVRKIPLWEEMLLHVTFMQAWVPEHALSLNFVTWTISVEIFFYITFPMVVWWIRHNKVGNKQLLCVVALVFLLTQLVLSSILSSPSYPGEPSLMHNITHLMPIFHWSSFLIGIVAAYWVVNNQDKLYFLGDSWFLIIFFIVICLLIAYAHEINQALGFVVSTPSSYGPLFGIFMVGLTANKGVLTSVLSAKPFVYLGALSYGVYIFQIIAWLMYQLFLQRYFDFTPAQHLMMGVLFLLIFSAIAHALIENPGNRYLRKRLMEIFNKYWPEN